jgi:hypothetical protein
VLLGEKLSGADWLGIVLVAAGALLVSMWRGTRWPRREPPAACLPPGNTPSSPHCWHLRSSLPAPRRSRIARADRFVPVGNGWQSYTNTRFGMSFEYPANIFALLDPPPENGDGRAFASADALLMIFATHNTLNETPASMKRDMVGMQDYEEVTYSPSGDTWLVLSGYRGDTIFYEKYFFRDGVISAFAIEFPQERKPFYAPIIERIEDSFRPGRSDWGAVHHREWEPTHNSDVSSWKAPRLLGASSRRT